MAHYSLPYHSQMPEQQFCVPSHYHDNRMINPPELGGWMEQSDGGGKFQLKRRRRCGQCGPCQVKDNCNKCQYCLRKDILKQACVLRKCVYLRKPVPHSRPEIPNGGKPKGAEGERGKDVGNGGGRSSSCSSTNQDSPHKPPSSTPSTIPTPTTKPALVSPSAVAAAAAVVQTAELSSCQVVKKPYSMPVSKAVGDALRVNGLPANVGPPDPLPTSGLRVNEGTDMGNRMMNCGFPAANKGVREDVPVNKVVGDVVRSNGVPVNKSVGDAVRSNDQSVNKGLGDMVRSNGLPVNKAVGDPLRTSALDQHHTAMMDAAGALNSCRMSYMSDTRGMDSGGRGPAQVLGPATSSSSCGFGMGNNVPTSPACAMSKDFPLAQREQFRPPAEQWGAVPYGYSHPNPWAPPTPASYGIPSGGSYYPGSLGSSCQLGMSNPANPFTAPSQSSFHCAVPFPHANFSTHGNFHASASAVQSPMTSPFYPPPMQIPSTLPNFPSFSQLPSSAGPHHTYTAARPPVYPGSLYTSFRPSYEPQIYHVQVSTTTTPSSPFLKPHQPLPDRLSGSGNSVSVRHNESESDRHNEFESGVHGKSGRHNSKSQTPDTDNRVEDAEMAQKPSSESSLPWLKSYVCDETDKSGASHCCTENSADQNCTGKEEPNKTCVTSAAKADNSKRGGAGGSRGGNPDEDLLHALKQVIGLRQCRSGSSEDFKLGPSLRSEECCDRDAELISNIRDLAFVKARNRSKTEGSHEHVPLCPRKRPSHCRKIQPFTKEVSKSGQPMFRLKTRQTCKYERDFSVRSDRTACAKSTPSHTVSAAHTHCQQVCNHSSARCHQTINPGEKSHQITSHVMDSGSAEHAAHSFSLGNSSAAGIDVSVCPSQEKDVRKLEVRTECDVCTDDGRDVGVACGHPDDGEQETESGASPSNPNRISRPNSTPAADSRSGLNCDGSVSAVDSEWEEDDAS